MSVAVYPNMPAEWFPIRFEAFNPATGEIVWTHTVERPAAGTLSKLEIPALAKQHGFQVGMRARYADGTITEKWPE